MRKVKDSWHWKNDERSLYFFAAGDWQGYWPVEKQVQYRAVDNSQWRRHSVHRKSEKHSLDLGIIVAGEVTLKLRLEEQNGKHQGKQDEECCRLGNGRCLNPENQAKMARADRSSAERVASCLWSTYKHEFSFPQKRKELSLYVPIHVIASDSIVWRRLTPEEWRSAQGSQGNPGRSRWTGGIGKIIQDLGNVRMHLDGAQKRIKMHFRFVACTDGS